MNLNRSVSKQLNGEMTVKVIGWGEDSLGAIVIRMKTLNDEDLIARFSDEEFLYFACENIATQLKLNADCSPSIQFILDEAVGHHVKVFAAHVDGYQRVKFLRA